MSYGIASLPIRRFQVGGPTGFFSPEAQASFANMMTPEQHADMEAQAEAQAAANAAMTAAMDMGINAPTSVSSPVGLGPQQTDVSLAAPEPAVNPFGLFSPVAEIGPMSITPASLAALAVPAISPVVTAINAINALSPTSVAVEDPSQTAVFSVAAPAAMSISPIAPVSYGPENQIAALNAMTQQQEPAPVSIATPVAVADLGPPSDVAAQMAAVDVEDAAAGLAAANAQAAAGISAEDEGVSVSPVAVSEAVEAAVSAADAADAAAAEGAAAAAADAGAADAGDSGGGGGGDSGGAGGDSGDSGGGGCFLTTAAVKHLKQKDNGEVLNTLREFRDTYMRKDKDKSKDVAWYYINSPKIMRELDKHEDAGQIYKEMYNDYILPAYREIKDGNNEAAYEIYKDLIQYAKFKSGVESDELTPKPKHTGYAKGGMPEVARHVQSQGRGQDKMLVHMTPGEVQGLQYLAMRHGGSLTINPNTGLPEAGFLSSLLPTLAGAALGATGVGAPLAALMIGGGYGLATGSLKKGLMAGLGAFGGAGLGAGLTAAGAATTPAMTGTAGSLISNPAMFSVDPAISAAANAPTVAALPSTATQTISAIPGGSFVAPPPPPPPPVFGAPTAPTIVPTTPAQALLRPTIPEFSAAPAGFIPQSGAQQAIAAAPMASLPSAPATGVEGLKQAGRGLMSLTDKAGREAFTAGVKEAAFGLGSTTIGMAAAYPALSGEFDEQNILKRQEYIRPFSYDSGFQGDREGFEYRTGKPGESTAEQLYFDQRFTPMGVFKPGREPVYGTYAAGGNVGFDDQLNMETGGMAAYSDTFYGGGLTALAAGGKAMPPRYLEGAGDGMSDSIKARIGGVQEARLADGEFVIPADVVSHLGNGSSNAGAKKLHAMMDRIRKARTGKKGQAPEVKTEKYMPA